MKNKTIASKLKEEMLSKFKDSIRQNCGGDAYLTFSVSTWLIFSAITVLSITVFILLVLLLQLFLGLTVLWLLRFFVALMLVEPYTNHSSLSFFVP